MEDCIFCKIINKEIPSNMVYENDKIFAFLDNNPVNKGHTLIVPKGHYVDMLETPDDVLGDMMTRAKKIAEAVLKGVKADGFNTAMNTKPAAGQVVFHTHMHIIPRFENDGFKHWKGKQLSPEEMQKIRDDVKKELQ